MKRYESYSSSGFDWLGETPSHWKVLRMCYMFKPVSIKNTSGEINLSVYRDYGVIPTDSRDDNHNVISEDTSNYKLVEEGDFVMNKMKCWMGSLGLSDYRGIVSPSYTVMKPLQSNYHKYTHYLLRSPQYIPQYKRLSYGVREGQWDLRFEDFRELPCLIPPLSEQQQIVSFLDTKTSLIDSLIEKTQRKIELLKEKKSSLINEVVTKGLNPNVEMKDSGVEWIGKIPSNWLIKPLYTVCEHSKEKNEDGESTVLSLSYGKLKVREVETNFGLLPESFDKYQRVRPGYIILRLTDLQNDKKSLRVGHSYLDGIITPVYVGLRCNSSILSEYLYYHLHNSDIKKVLYSLGGGLRQTLRFDELKRLPVPVFPIEQQQQIVEYLDEQTQLIEKTISIEEKRIELLKEYRQSLISEVVTGKRKVV